MQKYKTVDEFLNDLDADKRTQVEALRKLIFEVDPQLEERIKWNAPNYALAGDDRITFNLMNKERAVKLVLHMGATRKEDKKGAPVMQDESGLVEWNSDIRGMITFRSVEDVTANTNALKKIIHDWLLLS